MKSLHCMVLNPETGMDDYHEELNRALASAVLSTTGLFRPVTQPIHNDQFATPEFTVACVTALNGYNLRDADGNQLHYEVGVPKPGEGGWGFRVFGYMEWSVPKQMIACSSGESFAAGLIGRALGNEAMCANERQRDFEICTQAGAAFGRKVGQQWLSDVILAAQGV